MSRTEDTATGQHAPGRRLQAGADAGAAARPARRPIPPRRYRVGELVEFAGVSRQTIHNYTTMGLLPEAHWTPGGHRCYDASAFERLEQIAAMKAADKTLTEIRDYFAGMDTDTL